LKLQETMNIKKKFEVTGNHEYKETRLKLQETMNIRNKQYFKSHSLTFMYDYLPYFRGQVIYCRNNIVMFFLFV